jgi:hypothetical protein
MSIKNKFYYINKKNYKTIYFVFKHKTSLELTYNENNNTKLIPIFLKNKNFQEQYNLYLSSFKIFENNHKIIKFLINKLFEYKFYNNLNSLFYDLKIFNINISNIFFFVFKDKKNYMILKHFIIKSIKGLYYG